MNTVLLVTVFCIYFACCSKALPTNRIVGGEDAFEGQFRHQVSLRNKGHHNCGGSIISRNFILTAAHCVVERAYPGNNTLYDPSFLTVRIGTTDRFRGGVVMKVAEIIAHKDYAYNFNDVALLRLESPIIFSMNIQSIALATAEVPVGAKVIVSGWGRTKHGGDLPQTLLWNELTAISRSECSKRINFDSDSLLCLAHKRNNGACHGDSGGPAVYNGEIVGVANFVYTGCGTSYPDGYAKVFYHADWIRKHSDLK